MNASAVPSVVVPRDARMALIVAALLVAALFSSTLLGFHDVWTRQPYTHGYLVLGAVVWLAWRDRGLLRPEGGAWRFALPFAAALSLLWLSAHVTGVRVVEQLVLVPMLLLWLAGTAGRVTAARLAPLAAIALLAVPVWEILTPPLQSMTVAATGAVVALAGIPATLDGNVVTIPSGSFLIEGGCAGLNYFMAALVIGTVYAQGFLRAWQARLAAVALLASMAVVGNWLRVASLIAIGHASEMQSGLMDGHLVYGWVIFAVGILAFALSTGRLERWEARRWPGPQAAAPSSDATRSARAPIRGRAVILATAAVSIGPTAHLVIDSLPVQPVPSSPVASTGAWLADERAERPFAWRPDFRGATEELQESFTSGAERVIVDRFVYRSQGQEGELIGFSSRIAPDSAIVHERLFGQIGPHRKVVNEAIVRDEGGHVLVWYWYRVAGVETSSALRAKTLELWAFLTRMTTSELIAVSAACSSNDCSAAARALASFLDS